MPLDQATVRDSVLVMIPFIILLVVLVVLVIVAVAQYNALVKLNVAVDEAFAQIDVQLKRRADLIPNLVSTVKGYAAHEKDTLQAVTDARTQVMKASTVADTAAADGALTSALRGLFAVAEAYPDLKASTNFVALQGELAETENKIAFARQYYNDSVRTLNTKATTIPGTFFTGIAKVKEREYYELDDAAARQAPNVQF
jgi:LemA protein